MSTFKGRGIVLKEILSGESNKNVVLLLKEHGKMLVSARGAKNLKSKFLAGTQLFVYADFVIYDGGRFNSITEINIIESFYQVSTDYEKLCYGNYFLEVCDKTLQVGLNCDDILLLLLKSLKQLAKGILSPNFICVVFECKFLQYSGYEIELYNCSFCFKCYNQFNYIGLNGVICDKCFNLSKDSIKISKGTKDALNYIFTSKLDTLFMFRISEKVLCELIILNELLIVYYFNTRFNSKEFL